METKKEIQVKPILPKNLGHWLEKKNIARQGKYQFENFTPRVMYLWNRPFLLLLINIFNFFFRNNNGKVIR